MKFIASAVVAWLALVLPVAGIAGQGATSKPSWTCIRGVCVGTSVAAMYHRYGPGWATPYDGAVAAGIAVPGGRVYATNMGDLCRATRRITTISTSDPIVRLPDGVQIATKIPFGPKWRGYTYFTRGDFNGAWRKRISVKGAKVEVRLDAQGPGNRRRAHPRLESPVRRLTLHWRGPTSSSRFARPAAISAKCWSLGEPSLRYRSSHRIAACSCFGDPRSA